MITVTITAMKIHEIEATVVEEIIIIIIRKAYVIMMNTKMTGVEDSNLRENLGSNGKIDNGMLGIKDSKITDSIS